MNNNPIESSVYLENLAKEVLEQYNIKADNIAIIQSGTIKTVWKIKYKDKLLCLKRLRQPYDRASFSVNAQLYIKSVGGNVPGIILTPSKEGILQYKTELFVLYEWLEGRNLNFNNPIDLAYAIKGLAAFHIASKGYKPEEESKISSKANKSPNQYESILNKFKLWKEESITKTASPSYSSYLKVVDSMISLGNEAKRLIALSLYNQLTADSNSQVLCHQDYGTGNAILGKTGVIILDLDGVTLDLPLRDLRKLIFKYEEPNGKWQRETLTNIINWYSEVNPLSEEEKQILYIDLLFPHRFYGLVKNLFRNNKPLKASEIEKIAVFEQSKVQLLKEFINEKALINNSKLIKKVEPIKKVESVKEIEPIKKAEPDEKNELINKPQTIKFDDLIKIENNDLVTNEESLNKDKIIENGDLIKKEVSALKVAFVCTEKLTVPPIDGGAIQIYIEGILPYLKNQHNITVFCVSHPKLPDNEFKDGVRYIRVPAKDQDDYISNVAAKLDSSYDLIQIFNRPKWVLPLGEKFPNTKISLSLHNEMFELKKITPANAVKCIERVEYINTVSKFIADGVQRLYPSAMNKLNVIYSGADIEKYKTNWSKEGSLNRSILKKKYNIENYKVVLFVGRLSEKKGVHVLLKAMNEIMSYYSNVALVIVGSKWFGGNKVDDYTKSLITLSKELSGPIVFTGFLPPDEVYAHYNLADIFVCPSQWNEPLARVHYEAMAAGLPIITTNRGGNSEVVSGLGNGFVLADYTNPFTLAKYIDFLLRNPDKASQIGQTGRKIAEEKHSWDKVAQNVLNAINKVLK